MERYLSRAFLLIASKNSSLFLSFFFVWVSLSHIYFALDTCTRQISICSSVTTGLRSRVPCVRESTMWVKIWLVQRKQQQLLRARAVLFFFPFLVWTDAGRKKCFSLFFSPRTSIHFAEYKLRDLPFQLCLGWFKCRYENWLQGALECDFCAIASKDAFCKRLNERSQRTLVHWFTYLKDSTRVYLYDAYNKCKRLSYRPDRHRLLRV